MDQASNVFKRAEKEYKNSREKFYLLLREVITNSIHAVLIRKQREASFLPMIDVSITQYEKEYSITINDNGDGFTDANQQYFNELDSINVEKERLNYHPLGQGRLALVYFADSTTYETVFCKDGENRTKMFKYPTDDNSNTLFNLNSYEDVASSSETYTKTIIKVTSQQKVLRANTFFRKYSNLVDLYNWVVETFFPFFINTPDLQINISYNNERKEINKNSIETDTEKISFQLKLNEYDEVKDYAFVIWLIKRKLNNQDKEVVCFARNLRAELANGKLEYILDNNDNYQFYLTSDLFDERVDTKGEKIVIPDDYYNVIKSKVNEQLDNRFKDVIDENKNKEKQNLERFKEKYPSLEAFASSDCFEGKIVKGEKDFVKNAINEKGRLEESFWTQYNSNTNNKYELSEDCQKLVNSSLQIYVKHRENVLNYLQSLIHQYESDGTEKREAERSIHELFFKRGVELKKSVNINGLHNLWILDDKFTTFSNDFKAKSTKQGQPLSDIYIWADNPKKTKQVLILELKSTTKAHNAGNKDEGMINQVIRYARDFYNNPQKVLNWNVNTDSIQYIGLILASKADIGKEIAKNHADYKKIPFLENSYYKEDQFSVRLDSPAHTKDIRIELYSFEEIYELASSRNDVFFRLLRNELRMEND